MNPSLSEVKSVATTNAANGTAPSSRPPTKSAPISSHLTFINSPTNLPASGFIITGFISKNHLEVLPLANVNASSFPPSRNANSRTKSTRRIQRASSRSIAGTDMEEAIGLRRMNLPFVIAMVVVALMSHRLRGPIVSHDSERR